MNKFLVVLITPVLFVCCKKHNETGSIADPSSTPAKDFSPLTQIVQANLPQLGGNAGLLLMSREGAVLYKQYFGSYTDSTYIPVASGSKWPSMACVLSLVDDGLINLD